MSTVTPLLGRTVASAVEQLCCCGLLHRYFLSEDSDSGEDEDESDYDYFHHLREGAIEDEMAAAAVPPPVARSVSTSETALRCSVCMNDFDAGLRRPLILPRCGHTYCRICIKDLAARNDITCPSCRLKYPNTEPDNLPINFNIQCLAVSTSTLAPNPFSLPQQPKEDEGSACPEHKVRISFWCTSCEVAACGECLFERHPRPSHHICRIQEVVTKIKEQAEDLSRESCDDIVLRLGESVSRTLRDVSDLQEAAHLLQETARVNRAALAANDLASITTVYESAKTVRHRVAALDYGNQEGGNTNRGEDVVPVGRPAVLALSDNGCLAKVQVESKGIHVYSLRSASTAYSVAIKLGVLTACVKKEDPLVFLDLIAGERRLGRLYITLIGSMRRSQQFLALCLGTLGPSYRNSKFDGISERGLPGEFVRGGDYQGRAGLGGEALMDNLEWGGKWSRPKKAGQICGVGGGGDDERKFGSLFAICLRDNADDNFRCPFGLVTEGLGVIEVACRHEPFNVVHIGDCGVVIPV